MAGRLAIMARPRAGDWLEDEISGWRAQGVEIVVSLLGKRSASLSFNAKQVSAASKAWNFFHSPFRTAACQRH